MAKISPQRGLDEIVPYVPGKPIEEVQREFGLDEVIKLASNENPLGPSPCAQEALHQAVSQLNFYPDGQSYYLCQAIARHYGLNPAQVHANSGAECVIMALCMAFLDNDTEVIVSQSSFPSYDIYTHMMRAKLIKTPMKEFRLDLEAMAAAITPRTKLIFVCNPNNPTATIVTRPEVERFLAQVPDHVLVVFDEAYYEFVDDPEYPQTLDYFRSGRSNIVIMRTLSKAYGLAGLRIGYLLGDPDLLTPLNTIKATFAVNLMAQVAGIAALQDEEFVRRTVESNRQNKAYLYQEFERLGLTYVPSQANFLIVRFGAQAKEVYNQLLRQGLIVRPCAGYDLPEYLRISIGSHPQNERLIAALETILQPA